MFITKRVIRNLRMATMVHAAVPHDEPDCRLKFIHLSKHIYEFKIKGTRGTTVKNIISLLIKNPYRVLICKSLVKE